MIVLKCLYLSMSFYLMDELKPNQTKPMNCQPPLTKRNPVTGFPKYVASITQSIVQLCQQLRKSRIKRLRQTVIAQSSVNFSYNPTSVFYNQASLSATTLLVRKVRTTIRIFPL